MKYVIFVQQDLIQCIYALILQLTLMWKIKAKVKQKANSIPIFFLSKNAVKRHLNIVLELIV